MSNPIFSGNMNLNISPVSSQTMACLSSIIAIGSPIIDITSQIDKELINKFGLKWGETVFATPENIEFLTKLKICQK